MPSKAKMALATLLVFGSASAALAESNNGTNHRGPVVWGRTTPTMLERPAPSARNANAMIAAITLVDMVIFSSCRKASLLQTGSARR